MNIEEMEYDIKADCRIPDIDPNHFAYVSMSAEEAWNLIQYDPETKFEFLCNGINRNGIKCNALLIPKKEEHENKTRYKFILQKGQHHTPGCSHVPLVERLSYSTPDFSMTDFHNALKQGINYYCKSTTMLKYRDRNLDRDGINCTEAGEVRVDDGETMYDWVNIYKHNDITQPSLSKICNDYCGRKY